MKKIFTLGLALMGFAGAANAATVDDIAPLKHSYVLVCDDLGARPGKGVLFGDDHFLDVTGGSTATNKGKVNLAEADGVLVTEEIAAKYGEYGEHLNFLRLKTKQDVIAIKVTALSKIIIFYQDNSKDDRYPVFSTTADLTGRLKDGTISPRDGAPAANLRRMEWTADDDGLVYIGDNNGDMYVSFIIVEANEAEGTPQVKLGQQTYEGGLWFKEVSCTPATAYGMTTDVYYTTDGTEPTAASTKYESPFKVYAPATIKFQAFVNGNAVPDANNEVGVSFSFDAPAISADGAKVTITSPYDGAKNFYTVNGGEAQEGSSFTLTESATVAAYSQIVNGSYATFTTKTTTQDVYVLNPIKEKKVITASGTAELDEEATAASTTGEVYKVVDGVINADKADFFVKNPSFAAVKNPDYQIDGKEVYIQMSNTNITFQVAEGDSVNVKVICSKNACKNIKANDAEDGSAVTDRMCYVNVSGTNYGGEDLKLNPEGNVIEFGLGAGTHTFQKYSGTGNILIASIEITPAETSGIATVNAAQKAQSTVTYNLAGQKVNESYKGVVIRNGKKVVQ